MEQDGVQNRKMNAVTIPRFGGASVLRNEVVDLPYELEECEVLIEVHACGINHLDCQLRAGELDTEHDIRLPCVPGADLSGKVRKIGDKVLNVKVGDAVFGRQSLARIVQGRGGACAEWCVVNAAHVVSKPLSLSHELAAAVPTAGMVAFAALRLVCRLHTRSNHQRACIAMPTQHVTVCAQKHTYQRVRIYSGQARRG